MPKIIPDILLIEDQKLNQTLIQKVLMKGGFTVLAFSDGQSAYNFFKDKDLGDSSGKLIAILMDINLKDETMDGIKTTKLIRKFELEHEKDPVLIYALTSSITHENLETYKKVKMNGCIAKGELVLNRLREALSINLKDPERFVAPNDNEIILKEESLPIFSRRHSNSEILIVEDVEISLRVAVRNLKINGYSVETASSPAEALEKYKSHKGTLKAILMDIDLGNTISGIEVSSQIRELELNSEIKVSPILILALTGNVSLENIKEYENAGMNGCILKGRDLTSSLKIAMEQSLQNPGLFVSLILPDLRKISPSTSNSHVLGLKSPLLHSPSTSPLPTWPSYDNQEIILNFQKIDFEKKKKNKLIKNENEEKKHSLSSPK